MICICIVCESAYIYMTQGWTLKKDAVKLVAGAQA